MQNSPFTGEYGHRFGMVHLFPISHFTLDKPLVEPPRLLRDRLGRTIRNNRALPVWTLYVHANLE